MGIQISLYNAAGEEHPEWDRLRHSGDRDFFGWTEGLPQVDGDATNAWLDGAFRPADFPRWLAALPADRPNPDRFPLMLRLLEADDQWWISVSY